jgi:tRNA(adenine34) deaminase
MEKAALYKNIVAVLDDEKYMSIALEQARAAFVCDEVPVGAVLVHSGAIIACAHNMTETMRNAAAHAEMQVIASAGGIVGKYLCECTMYATIEPCPMCAAAMFWAQLGTLVYGAPDAKRGYTLIGTPLLHPKTIVRAGILSRECGALMTDFFKNKRTIN